MKNAIEFFNNVWTGIDIHSNKPAILTMEQLGNIVENAMKYEREKVEVVTDNQNQELNLTCVSNNIEYCENDCDSNTILHVNVLQDGDSFEKWLCKDCIKIELKHGNMIEIL